MRRFLIVSVLLAALPVPAIADGAIVGVSVNRTKEEVRNPITLEGSVALMKGSDESSAEHIGYFDYSQPDVLMVPRSAKGEPTADLWLRMLFYATGLDNLRGAKAVFLLNTGAAFESEAIVVEMDRGRKVYTLKIFVNTSDLGGGVESVLMDVRHKDNKNTLLVFNWRSHGSADRAFKFVVQYLPGLAKMNCQEIYRHCRSLIPAIATPVFDNSAQAQLAAKLAAAEAKIGELTGLNERLEQENETLKKIPSPQSDPAVQQRLKDLEAQIEQLKKELEDMARERDNAIAEKAVLQAYIESQKAQNPPQPEPQPEKNAKPPTLPVEWTARLFVYGRPGTTIYWEAKNDSGKVLATSTKPPKGTYPMINNCGYVSFSCIVAPSDVEVKYWRNGCWCVAGTVKLCPGQTSNIRIGGDPQ